MSLTVLNKIKNFFMRLHIAQQHHLLVNLEQIFTASTQLSKYFFVSEPRGFSSHIIRQQTACLLAGCSCSVHACIHVATVVMVMLGFLAVCLYLLHLEFPL